MSLKKPIAQNGDSQHETAQLSYSTARHACFFLLVVSKTCDNSSSSHIILVKVVKALGYTSNLGHRFKLPK